MDEISTVRLDNFSGHVTQTFKLSKLLEIFQIFNFILGFILGLL